MNHKVNTNIEKIGAYLIILLACFFAFLPVYWILSTSFKTRVDTFAIPPKWIFTPILDHYHNIFSQFHIHKFFANSLIVSVGTTLIALLIGCPAAYSFARFKFRGSKDLSFWILSLRMAPPIAFVIPIYLLMANLKLLDTPWALILTYLTFTLPIVTWVMMGFFMSIPRELEEAALVDGLGRLGVFSRITLPLSLPGLWTTALISFIFSWNEFLYALILTGSNARTLPVVVSAFNTQRGILWGEMAAVSTITVIPLLILTWVVHKHFVKGLLLGAVKG